MRALRQVVNVPATEHGPALARRAVAAAMAAWGEDQLCGDAQLLVSELVTNAYLYAPDTDSYELVLARRNNGVRIALADGSLTRPLMREARPEATGGRGMRLVQALGARWGVDSYRGGKRVWVDLEHE